MITTIEQYKQSEAISDLPIGLFLKHLPDILLIAQSISENKDLITKLPRSITIEGKKYYLIVTKDAEWFGGYYCFTSKEWYILINDKQRKKEVKDLLKDYLFD